MQLFLVNDIFPSSFLGISRSICYYLRIFWNFFYYIPMVLLHTLLSDLMLEFLVSLKVELLFLLVRLKDLVINLWFLLVELRSSLDLGTISSISIGNSGSGYRSGIQTSVNVGVGTSSTGTGNIEFVGAAAISGGTHCKCCDYKSWIWLHFIPINRLLYLMIP